MSASNLSVEFVSSADAIPAALWDACFPPPLEGRWWYQTLESSGLDDQFTFAYAVVRDGKRAVGIAPLFVMNLPLKLVLPKRALPIASVCEKLFPSLLQPKTLFVGSPCGEEGNVGLLPGVERRSVLSCLQQALERKAADLHAALLVWKDFPASYDDDMSRLASERPLFHLVSFPGAIARMPTRRKEDFLATLKGSRRHSLLKRIRSSLTHVDIDIEVVQFPDPATIDTIFELFWQTYQKATTKFEKLNRRFFEVVATKPAAHFLILREKRSREMLAFALYFEIGNHIINKFGGFDYGRPKEWFLYFRLWDALLDQALSRGASSIQSGQTGYAAKIAVGHGLVPLNNYCQHRNRLVHTIGRTLARTIGWQTLDRDLAIYLKAYPDLAPLPAQQKRAEI